MTWMSLSRTVLVDHGLICARVSVRDWDMQQESAAGSIAICVLTYAQRTGVTQRSTTASALVWNAVDLLHSRVPKCLEYFLVRKQNMQCMPNAS